MRPLYRGLTLPGCYCRRSSTSTRGFVDRSKSESQSPEMAIAKRSEFHCRFFLVHACARVRSFLQNATGIASPVYIVFGVHGLELGPTDDTPYGNGGLSPETWSINRRGGKMVSGKGLTGERAGSSVQGVHLLMGMALQLPGAIDIQSI